MSKKTFLAALFVLCAVIMWQGAALSQVMGSCPDIGKCASGCRQYSRSNPYIVCTSTGSGCCEYNLYEIFCEKEEEGSGPCDNVDGYRDGAFLANRVCDEVNRICVTPEPNCIQNENTCDINGEFTCGYSSPIPPECTYEGPFDGGLTITDVCIENCPDLGVSRMQHVETQHYYCRNVRCPDQFPSLGSDCYIRKVTYGAECTP